MGEARGRQTDLAGKYRLIAELGQGGMATVYLAVAMGSSGFRKLAVVKLIRPQFASDPDLIGMFLDEARLCARLNHPNVVQTYDVGLDNGQHLMAMEYLDGVSFNAAISRLSRDRGKLGFTLRARVLLDVLEGLRYAHELKDYDGTPLHIVHRDVTPHNIFVTYEGQVKLLDFGIAKAATSSVQTATGVIKGKLRYMSPEQAMGDPVDARTDVYAVGVMLWEALTGRRRFAPDLSDVAMFTRVAAGEVPQAPSATTLGLPVEIDGILKRALAPNRDDRYQSAGAMHADLEAALRNTEPASLRDLGPMLVTAFASERQQIRQVIEEQFRLMDSGPPTKVAEGRPEVPSVHPPQGTDSRIEAIPVESTTTKGVSTLATSPGGERKRPRFAVWGVVAATAMATVATIGVRVLSPPKIESAVGAAGGTTVHPTKEQDDRQGSSPQPPTAAAAEETTPPNTAMAPRSGLDKTQPLAAGHHEDVTSSIPGRSGSSAPTRDRTHPSGGVPVVASPTAPAPDAGASAAAVSAEPVPFRTPTTKPKVQLERDNPWP
jgi:serine/threonine-protein kinase